MRHLLDGIERLPEADFNVACASSTPRSILAGHDLNWEKVIQFAQVHGVLHFLATALARDEFSPPEPWSGLLMKQHQRNVARAMLQHRECTLILNALAKASVPAVPFKGTSLSKLLYGRVADRVSSDIDILIPAEQLSPAKAVLENLGYVIADSVSRLETEVLLSSGNEMVYVNPRTGVLVEVHWQLFETDRACGFPTDFEELHIFEGAIANEDLFLILALHGLAHHWEALKWSVDIDAFVRNVPVKWDVLFERAAASGTTRATGIAILLAHSLFDTPLPKPISDATSSWLTRRYLRGLLMAHPIPPVLDFWMQLAARERWIDRLRFIRFVARVKPWDHTVGGPKRLMRLIRLLKESFRASRLAEVQTIPELQGSERPSASPGIDESAHHHS